MDLFPKYNGQQVFACTLESIVSSPRLQFHISVINTLYCSKHSFFWRAGLNLAELSFSVSK